MSEHCDEVARERIAALDRRLTELRLADERALQIALSGAKEAVIKAEHANEKRFEGVNEFRGQLADQGSKFINRTEVGVMVDSLKEHMNRMEGRIATSAARGAGAGDLWKAILAGIGALVAVAGFVLVLMSR